MYGFGSYSEFPYSDVTTTAGTIETGVAASSGVAVGAFVANPVFSGVFAAAGTSVVLSTGAPIFSGAFSSSGLAVSSWVGTGVFNSVGSCSGVATASWVGTGIFNSQGFSAGVAVALFISDPRHIVSNDMLELPVDYWLAGNPVVKEVGNTFQGSTGKAGTKKIASGSGLAQLSQNKSTFTVTTNSRGFD